MRAQGKLEKGKVLESKPAEFRQLPATNLTQQKGQRDDVALKLDSICGSKVKTQKTFIK